MLQRAFLRAFAPILQSFQQHVLSVSFNLRTYIGAVVTKFKTDSFFRRIFSMSDAFVRCQLTFDMSFIHLYFCLVACHAIFVTDVEKFWNLLWKETIVLTHNSIPICLDTASSELGCNPRKGARPFEALCERELWLHQRHWGS